MTQKERFNKTLQFKSVDRSPFMEIALWEQTVERWRGEGLPEHAASADLLSGNKYFGLEGYEIVYFNLTFPEPCPHDRILSEDERYVTFIDGMGRKRISLKEGSVRGMRMSMDSYVQHPIKTREDFSAIKSGYESGFESRLPGNWAEVKTSLKKSLRPTLFLDRYFASFGYYSMLRNWMGTEGLSYMFYDDPDLVHNCLDFLTEFITAFLSTALSGVSFDLYYIHEDLAGRNGPLLSPDLFKRFFLRHYARFVAFLKSHGVKNVIVDTDGNFDVLIPLFLESGVGGFGPIEAAAGMDPVGLRKKYGNCFFMIGGIDKRVLTWGRDSVESELRRVIPPMIEQGGFIPTIDHSIPPNVSMDSFRYYLEMKWKAIHGKF
jgi:uroporphyrinogen decarboxylase